MTTVPGHAHDEKRYTFMVPSDSEPANNAGPKPELPTNPLRIAEMAIEIQVEKLRVAEAMSARDVLVQKLSDAYTSIREKTDLIDRLQQALNAAMGANTNTTNVPFSTSPRQGWNPPADMSGLRSQVADLEALIQELRVGTRNAMGPPPKYEEEDGKNASPVIPDIQTIAASTSPLAISTPTLPSILRKDRSVQTLVSDEPEDMVNARFAILASMPLPDNPPDDTLKPIILPPTCTLQEFLGSTSGSLRNLLGNYCVLQSLTTKWCPSREEHGCFYSPQVDVTARMKQPTECFYNREGLWYYAGLYQAFWLEDLSLKEWVELPTETANYLVKETISARKNVSPQNIYEVNQLYNAGALKVACVGLQCVGFSQEVYKSVLEHAAKFTQAKWKSMNPMATASNPASPPIASNSPGTGVASNAPSKSASTPIKPISGMSRPVSPTLLGTATAGFGAVAAGLGLGKGGTWNTTAALSAQSANQGLTLATGTENLQGVENVAYRGMAKK
ncbi:hypothetical protein NP233_g4688 [Leucocoprinus birnbaumii]|uniref:DUF6697 domain-containing protein n=1 Tax=Leucocoprinus birnbaumii TaxID=56174 RepID=A0AAD5W0N1_9AGAR|nr:hypothetical protein NP233_g4688 [Leucocoprinus birnbaumii]